MDAANDSAPRGKPRLGLLHLAGAALAAVGLGVLIWLAMIMYGRTPRDEALLVAIGIPLLMLIAWAGVALLLSGLTWLFRRTGS